jgi:hypothetical protein
MIPKHSNCWNGDVDVVATSALQEKVQGLGLGAGLVVQHAATTTQPLSGF